MANFGKGRINNDAELIAVLMPQIQASIDAVVDRLLDSLKQTIQDVVYSYPESLWYDRTMQFDRQWEKKEGALRGRITETMINFTTQLLTYNPKGHQHSQWGNPIPEDFATAIFEGYEVFNTGVYIPARDAWGIWMSKYANFANVYKMFSGEMRNRGLPRSAW